MENSVKDQLSSLPNDFLIKMKMENSEDQLSSLSDDILIKILSLLPIKTAVATSVLSRRWINLWTHFTAFHLHETPIYYDDDESGTRDYTPSNLTPILNHLLPKLNSPVISTFSLVANDNTNINPDSVNSWIDLVCARNVKYFNLQCFYDEYLVPLPINCLFQCQSLVSLYLQVRCVSYGVTLEQINLPNLKELYVSSLHEGDETVMNKLFTCCPRLQVLRFFCNLGPDYNNFEKREFPVFISGQNLKSLYIQFYKHYDFDNVVVVYIDAPNLQVFRVDDFTLIQIRFTSQPIELIEAKLKCSNGSWSRENMEVFRVISGVSHLKIADSILENLFLPLDYQLPSFRNFELPSFTNFELPVFSNLSKLVTSVSTIGIWKTQFLKLLDCTPNLEFLDIGLQFSSRLIDDVNDPANLFPQALSAPSCLVHRVKKMEFEMIGILESQYHCQELELEVVKYMLSHARALEELVINVHCIAEQKDELLLHEELELHHLYENLRDLPRNLGVHCSITLKFVLFYGIRLDFPHQMEFEDGGANSSSSLYPKYYYSATPLITLKESLST